MKWVVSCWFIGFEARHGLVSTAVSCWLIRFEARHDSVLHGPCLAIGSMLSQRPKHGYVFYSHNFVLNYENNITKFKAKKDDFILNIEIKLIYTMFIGRVVPCRGGLIRLTTGPHRASQIGQCHA
jgi:hypothetical protein